MSELELTIQERELIAQMAAMWQGKREMLSASDLDLFDSLWATSSAFRDAYSTNPEISEALAAINAHAMKSRSSPPSLEGYL